jgi:bisphosphoglycerate-dependent phosphoglycerate mutase
LRFYFVRHGESEANSLHIVSNRDLPHGLTAKGREQADMLANQLASSGITKIFTSPLLRARQTAAILAHALGLEVVVSDALACMLPLMLANVSFEMLPELPFPNTGYVMAEQHGTQLACLEWCGVPLQDA